MLTARVYAVRWTAGVFFCASLTNAIAQDNANIPSLEQLLQTDVVTASRFAQAQTQAPASVEVITADQIRALGYRSLTDVLRGIAGLHITNDHTYEYAGVNGLSNLGDYNSRLLVLLDGMRLNEPVYDQGPLGWLFPLDLALIERIEFVRGPGSSLYGSNAQYGVINVITKRNVQNVAGVGTGSYGLREWRSVLAGDAAQNVRYQLAASRQVQRGQTFTYPEFAAPGEPAPSISLDRERVTRLNASLRAGDWSLRSIYTSRYKQEPTATYGALVGDPRNDARDVLHITELSGTQVFGDTAQWNNRVLFGRYRFASKYPYEQESGDAALSIDTAHARWVNIESVFDYAINANCRLVSGVEVQRNVKIAQRSFDVGGATVLDDKRTTSRIGLFAQVEATLSERLKAYVGARADRADDNSAASPRLALIWNPAYGLTFRASSGRAFRAPNAYESYYSYPAPAEGLVSSVVNPSLKPETLVQSELAVDYLPDPTLKLTGALFTAKSDDQISFIVQDLIAQYKNTPGVTARGGRAGLEGVFAGGGKFKLGASWQRARDNGSNELRTNAPRLTTQAQLITPLAAGWTLGTELVHVGARRGKSSEIPGYTLLNLSLSKLDVIRDLDVTFSAFNALGKKYFDPAGEEAVQERFEQEGRSLRLQLDYRF